MTLASDPKYARQRTSNLWGWPIGLFVLVAAGAVLVLLTARDERKAIGGLFFGLVILTVFGAIVATLRRNRSERARRTRFPDQPWLWRKDWEAGVIESGTRTTLLVTAGLAIFWNAISLPACVVLLPRELAKGKYGVLAFTLPFLLIGLALAWIALYSFLRWKKFGTSHFYLAQAPGIIGGQLHGELHIPVRLPPASVVQLRLECARRITVGVGKNRQVKEDILWNTEQPGEPAPATLHRTVVPLVFVIPPGLRTTWISEDQREQIVWRLKATANLPGVDYATDFEVPVFQLP